MSDLSQTEKKEKINYEYEQHKNSLILICNTIFITVLVSVITLSITDVAITLPPYFLVAILLTTSSFAIPLVIEVILNLGNLRLSVFYDKKTEVDQEKISKDITELKRISLVVFLLFIILLFNQVLEINFWVAFIYVFFGRLIANVNFLSFLKFTDIHSVMKILEYVFLFPLKKETKINKIKNITLHILGTVFNLLFFYFALNNGESFFNFFEKAKLIVCNFLCF